MSTPADQVINNFFSLPTANDPFVPTDPYAIQGQPVSPDLLAPVTVTAKYTGGNSTPVTASVVPSFFSDLFKPPKLYFTLGAAAVVYYFLTNNNKRKRLKR